MPTFTIARVWCWPDRAGELAWTKRRLPTRFFTVPSGLLFCGANLAATRLPHPHLRCVFCFVKTRSLVGRAVLCPPDVSGCTDCGASRTCGTRPTNALRLWVEIGARPSWPQCCRGGWSVSGLFSTIRGARRSRARKSAENKIQPENIGAAPLTPWRGEDCTPYITLRLSVVAV